MCSYRPALSGFCDDGNVVCVTALSYKVAAGHMRLFSSCRVVSVSEEQNFKSYLILIEIQVATCGRWLLY